VGVSGSDEKKKQKKKKATDRSHTVVSRVHEKSKNWVIYRVPVSGECR
jgi:hypothetical protein